MLSGGEYSCSYGLDQANGVCNPLYEAPPSFLCPITMELMEDPVIILGSMQTVSRAAARQWFYLGNYRCPVTNIELQTCKTIPNRTLRAAIQEWQQSGGKHIEKSFLCPMTNEVLKDPVVMVGSMQTVAREAAEKWLAAGNMRCPVTNVTLKNRLLVTNYALKGALEEWEAVHGKLLTKGRKAPRRSPVVQGSSSFSHRFQSGQQVVGIASDDAPMQDKVCMQGGADSFLQYNLLLQYALAADSWTKRNGSVKGFIQERKEVVNDKGHGNHMNGRNCLTIHGNIGINSIAIMIALLMAGMTLDYQGGDGWKTLTFFSLLSSN